MDFFDDDSFLTDQTPPENAPAVTMQEESAPDEQAQPSCAPTGEFNKEFLDQVFWGLDGSAVKRRRGGVKHALKLLILVICAACIGFFAAVGIIRNRSWLSDQLAGDALMRFTLPVADVPDTDDGDTEADGKFTTEGLAKAVSPSVVSLICYSSDSFFSRVGQGSGIIISEDGYIVTNAHVVDAATGALTVILSDESEYSATLVGSDSSSDIAVIKINAQDLTPAQFADSDQVNLGEEVMTIGTPAGLMNSVTKGIVSGLDRRISTDSDGLEMQCIQIDAAINPGNSGGALFNMWGQVIGITSSKLASDYDGIGFAISTNAAKPIIENLMENGYVADRFRIGIMFYEVSEESAAEFGIPAGLHIQEIDADCDIANTDLAVNDIITAINGVAIDSSEEILEVLKDAKPGDTARATVLRLNDDGRADKTFEISFKLMPAETSVQQTDE